MKYEKEFNEWLNNMKKSEGFGIQDIWNAAIEFMESRGCDTCKHSPEDIYKEKCKYCKHVDNNEDNWEPKE